MLPPRDKILVPIDIIDKLMPPRQILWDGKDFSGDWTSGDGTVFFIFTLRQFERWLRQYEMSHLPEDVIEHQYPTALRESIIAFR